MLPIDVTARSYYRSLKNPLNGIDETNGRTVEQPTTPTTTTKEDAKAEQVRAPRSLEAQIRDWYVSRAQEAHPGLREAARNDVRTFVQNAQDDDKAQQQSARYLAPSVRI
jgi:hypothetical protein